jgi:DNA-binding response OmpR family regulator
MSKRLLVVDDEPNLLRAVAACLKAEAYEVSTVVSNRLPVTLKRAGA